jgi:hypothetical protein
MILLRPIRQISVVNLATRGEKNLLAFQTFALSYDTPNKNVHFHAGRLSQPSKLLSFSTAGRIEINF